jgi:hypothetical protein
VPEPLRERFVIDVRFFALRPQEEAERALAPVRAVAPTVLDTVTERRYRDAGSVFMEPLPLPWVDRSTALRDFPREAADALLALIGPDSGTQLGLVELRLLGEALARSPAVPNARPSRRAHLSLYAGGGGTASSSALDEHLITVVDALAPWAQDEIMPTFLGAAQGTTADELRAIYGPERYDRLAEIKTRYDPTTQHQAQQPPMRMHPLLTAPVSEGHSSRIPPKRHSRGESFDEGVLTMADLTAQVGRFGPTTPLEGRWISAQWHATVRCWFVCTAQQKRRDHPPHPTTTRPQPHRASTHAPIPWTKNE